MTLSEAETQYKLALARLEGNHPETLDADLASMRQAAEAGYAPAQYSYAYALELFKGDILTGIPFLISAAQQGHTLAREDLQELYARHERVRSRASELLTGEQVAALGLKEGSFLKKLLARDEEQNSPIGRLVGIVFTGGMGLAVLSKLLPGLAAWLDGAALTSEQGGMMTLLGGGFLFCLMALIAIILDWMQPGKAGYHPLVLGSLGLFFVYVALAFFLWGGYHLAYADRAAEDWWLTGTLLCFGGLLACLPLVKLLFYALGNAARGEPPHSVR